MHLLSKKVSWQAGIMWFSEYGKKLPLTAGTIDQRGDQLNLMWFLALRSDSESQFRTAAGLVSFINRINKS
jgi:hypothetical protein